MILLPTMCVTLQTLSSEMAQKESLSSGGGEMCACDDVALPAGIDSLLQAGLCLAPLDCREQRAVQPFPRSPKLERKAPKAAPPTQEQLCRRVEELQAESSRTQAHIQSLKKRRADLSRTTGGMKQQVRERYDNMWRLLQQDEQAILDFLELDLRQTRTRLDQILKIWEQHQDQVSRSISSTQRALSKSLHTSEDDKAQIDNVSVKKPDASEEEIRLNEHRFEALLQTLSHFSKNLNAQLQRKTLMLDSWPIVIDQQTCHSQIAVTSEGRGLTFCDWAPAAADRPLQFDKVCCALGSSPVVAGQSYWEVDVRCCSAWAVGVAYASLERKGRDKGAKLGRNRNSWCVELRNGNVSAWHNDWHVACQGALQTQPGTVGVWVDYDKGQLLFYDADTMVVLQSFSAAMTPLFDRAHHQFTEPLYPAVCFLRPPENQTWSNHLVFCRLSPP